MGAEYWNEAEERFRYGTDPELCDRCRLSVSGRCPFHRSLEFAGIGAAPADLTKQLAEEQLTELRKRWGS